MKNRIIHLLIFAFILSASSLLAQNKELDEKMNENMSFEQYSKVMNEYYSTQVPNVDGKIPGYKQFKRWEWFYKDRQYTDDNRPDFRQMFIDDQIQTKKFKANPSLQAGKSWEAVGPWGPISGTAGVGRINRLAIDPDNESTIWAGAAGGGVWKTTNRGVSWVTFKTTQFMSMGVTAIEIDETNTNTVYVGTGDADGPNIAGLGGNIYSVGIIKTTNGGTDWSLVSPFSNDAQSSGQLVYAIEVDYNDSKNVYAATNKGLFKSTNRGSSWTLIYGGNIIEMRMNLADSRLLHIVKKVNNSTQLFTTYNNADGSTYGDKTYSGCRRARLAVSKSNPKVIYALLANTAGGFLSLEKSTDNAQTWSRQATPASVGQNILYWFPNSASTGGQGWYDLAVAFSPDNDGTVFTGGIDIYKTSNSGADFFISSKWVQGTSGQYVHPDIHDLVFDSDGNIFAATDGSVAYSTNGGQTWIDISKGLNVLQIYRISSSESSEGEFILGSQDNGTFKYEYGDWTFALGGDGMDCGADPSDADVYYASQPNGTFYRSINGAGSFPKQIISRQAVGENALWVTPFKIDENNSNIYAGFTNVYKSTNKGDNWTKISSFNQYVRALAVSPLDANLIYAATYGGLFRTTNGGTNWDKIDNAGNITALAPSYDDKYTVYYTYVGYSASKHVSVYDGNGVTNITGNLSNYNYPANAIVVDPNNEDVYVGMDVGVYRLPASSNNWEVYSTDLPNTAITDLEYLKKSKKLRASTYGRGVWEVPVGDCNINKPNVTMSGEGLAMCKGETIKLTLQGVYTKYEWSNGSSKRSIDVSESGSYYVTVFDNKGCSMNSDVFDVEVIDVDTPVIKETGDKLNLCEGGSIKLSVNSFSGDFTWSDGQKGRAIWVSEVGEYSVFLNETKNGVTCSAESEKVTVVGIEAPEKPSISDDGEQLFSSNTEAESYQWYDEEGAINGANESSYSPLYNGNYMVEISNADGCKSISDSYEVDWFASISSNELSGNIHISPNPNSGKFLLEIFNLKSSNNEIIISDSFGKEIFRTNQISKTGMIELELNMKNISSGVYFVQILSEGETLNSKFVIE
jgi:Secretion system C-terminal sorting domain